MHGSRPASVALLLTALLAAPSAADVLYVHAGGNGQHADIQAAVDAAFDGDVLLVRSGTYDGFVVADKELWISADVGAQVRVAGHVRVEGLAADRQVVLVGLEIEPPGSTRPMPAALLVDDCDGDVRLRDCRVTGAAGQVDGSNCPGLAGGDALVVLSSLSVALEGCTLRGGTAAGSASTNPSTCVSGPGGTGLQLLDASAWVFDSLLEGGPGGDNWHQAGDGGLGAALLGSSQAFASGSRVQGGTGGFGWEFIDGRPGDGGDGVFVDASCALQHVDTQLLGGAAGGSLIGFVGQPGAPAGGPGMLLPVPGVARRLAAPVWVSAGTPIDVDCSGSRGDRVWILRGDAADLRVVPTAIGAWLIPFPPLMTRAPDLTLGASGAASITLSAAWVPPGQEAADLHLQTLTLAASGELRLSNAAPVLAIDCAQVLPDCDGDGSADSCELLAGEGDCDGDGYPDSCEADCNLNGVPDDCDISSGTSLDVNLNGIPDECEGNGVTWYVDPAAPPGGTGTASSPFATLAEAFAVAVDSHAIELADGVYVGPQNRDLDFGGRELTVRSANGPVGCVLDLQGSGRAFTLDSGEQGVLVQGLTIRNGSASQGGAIWSGNASYTLERCVFEGCQASASGGAVFAMALLAPTPPTVTLVESTFRGCAADGAGAVALSYVRAQVDACLFEDNLSTGSAGALSLLVRGGASWVTRTVFLGNAASTSGGAMTANTLGAGDEIVLVDALMAGNAAGVGGALWADGRVSVAASTLVSNTAGTRGGAVEVPAGGDLSLAGTILWDNSSPSGPQLHVSGTATVAALVEVAWCDVQGGQPGVVVQGSSALSWLGGNLDADPLFVDPDGPDGDPTTLADNDWRLGAGSPCLDAGDNTRVPPDALDLDGDGDVLEPTPLDLDGTPRFVDDPAPDVGNGSAPLVDMGAYERP